LGYSQALAFKKNNTSPGLRWVTPHICPFPHTDERYFEKFKVLIWLVPDQSPKYRIGEMNIV